MSEAERNVILKAALILVITEGWTPISSVTSRLGELPQVAKALSWLHLWGYVSAGDSGSMVRWDPQFTFEALWVRLVPERPCPLRFREEVAHSPHS